MLDGGGYQPIEIVFDHHVGDDSQPAATGVLDEPDGVVEVGRGACGDDDVGARLGERHRDLTADAGAGTGDDRDQVGETEGVEDHRLAAARLGAGRPANSGRSR